MKNLLNEVLGRDGLDIQHLLNREPTPRELSLIKVDTFSGKENEDPYEWMEMFENAAEANNWPINRLQSIAPGYFRDAARDWYVANKGDLNRWLDLEEEEGEGDDAVEIITPRFKTLFLKQFTPETKQNQWYHELMTIRQFAEEKVEEYARRFKKLLRKVNGGTAGAVLPPTLQVRMFLYGLSPIITPLVATENPATLEEAVNRAKLVETGYNYVPTKQIGFSTSVATKENPTMRDIIATEQTNDVDSLADQLQKLTLNYAN
ncbi:MAG TPA: hypothetical protein VM660_05035, partial [Bacillus sp. (in: firmicutes)]|nr:hypothetical protein [Bacillus sp. (in: firmicutes)]